MIDTVINQYDEDNNISCLKVTYDDENTLFVPKDESNRHYQEVLEWVAEGNTITDPQA